jgi:hypothetical protein
LNNDIKTRLYHQSKNHPQELAMEMNLKGMRAVVAAVIILAVGLGYRLFLVNDLKDNPELRRQLKMHLMVEIAGDIGADADAYKAAIAAGDRDAAEETALGTLRRKVTIHDLVMKGSRENILVRADYTVFRPDGEDHKTGYYKFSHSPVTGWRYKRETTALSWYLKLF